MLCLLLLLPLPVLAANPKKAPSVEFYASAWADVDASGAAHVDEVDKISRLEDVPALAAAVVHIKDLLKQRIESWQFVPATREGIAAPSRTHVHIRLGMDDGNGGLGIRIMSASTGLGARNMSPPRYPPNAMRGFREARVMLLVNYGEDGKVASVKVEELKDIYRGKLGGRGLAEFKDAAVDAARNWSFQNEIVDGRPRAGQTRVPVTFCLTDACTRMSEAQPDKPRDGEFAAIDPAVRLRSAVAGTAL
jgi:TonB family protein